MLIDDSFPQKKRTRKPVSANRMPALPDEKTVTPAKQPQPGPMITSEGVVRCRFDMFVKIRPHAATKYPKGSREWCHRGDKYTNDPGKMLQNLLRMLHNKRAEYGLVELYDNTKPKNDGQRLILKISGGFIKKNLIPDYYSMLADFPLADYLKEPIP